MTLVSDIWDEAQKLTGTCDETIVYRRINRAIEILANKSDWEPLLGDLDIAASETLVTLPRDVETPLTVSYGNYPALGRDRLFRFHLNGPGDRDVPVDWRWWGDEPEAILFRDITTPVVLTATPIEATDEGKTIWIYGTDADGQEVRTLQGGIFVPGYPITLGIGFAADPNAPVFGKITRISKPETDGHIQLWSVTNDALDTLLATYAWNDTEPRYRRIRLDRASPVVRIHYRRRNFAVARKTDLIPLENAEAVVMMVRALRYYDELAFDVATACEATAVRWLTEEQFSRNPTTFTPIQVVGHPSIDYIE